MTVEDKLEPPTFASAGADKWTMRKTERKGAEMCATFVKTATVCLSFDPSPLADIVSALAVAKNDHLEFSNNPRKVLLRVMEVGLQFVIRQY